MTSLVVCFLGVFLFVQSPQQTVSIRKAAELVPRDSAIKVTRLRIAVSGVVTGSSFRKDSTLQLFVQDSTGGIKLFTRHYTGPLLDAGDSIIAVGNLGLFFGAEEILNPEVRILKKNLRLVPEQASLQDINSGRYNGRLIRTRGRVINKVETPGAVVIYIRDSSNDTGKVLVSKGLFPSVDVSQLHTGDELMITGVASRYSPRPPFLDGNEIVVRDQSDLSLFQANRVERYIIAAIIFLLFLVALLLLFNQALRKKVKDRTSKLEYESQVLTEFYRSSSEIVGTLDIRAIYSSAIKTARKLVGTTYFLVVQINDDGNCFGDLVEIAGDDVGIKRVRFAVSSFSILTDKLSGDNAVWNSNIDEILGQSGDEEFKKLKSELREKKINTGINVKMEHDYVSMFVQASGDSRILIIFNHAYDIIDDFSRKMVISYIRMINLSVRAASLFQLMRRQEIALEELYNNSVFGLMSLSLDGRILTSNRIANDILGTKVVVGTKLSDHLCPHDKIRLDELLASMSKGHGTEFVRFESSIGRGGGSVQDIEFAIQFNREGESFYVSIQDVSEKKILEAAALQAQKMDAIEQLAAALSHDLKNSIGSMLGYSSLLKRKLPPDSREHRFAEMIEDAANRTATFINRVLGFSQIDGSTLELIEMNKFAEEVAEEFKNKTGDKYDFAVQKCSTPLYVNGSRGQLLQVVDSVFQNAVEAMPEGGRVVCSVSQREITQPPYNFVTKGTHCVLEISDTGIGMDDTIRRRVFEPFFTTKKKSRYTGLSMSAAFNIVKHHGGFIEVSSTLNVGTEIRIFLPLHQEKGKKHIEDEVSSLHGAGEKILVVDDEEMVRMLAHDILSEHNFTVIQATDGEDALKKLAEVPDVRLVVLDMIMPHMGGKDTCIEIKKRYRDVRVLICSGYSESNELRHLLEGYADGFLSKPYRTTELLNAVARTLKKAGD
ncbi:MAG: hybrid sensor histidine kinase/response regulator [Candidatus Kryptoniota bacterium]